MIFGITGTDGAGKGTVVNYLVKQKGFTHFSSRALLIAEIEKRNVEVTRNQMRLMGNEMRTLHGDEYIAKQAYQQIEAQEISNAVIESIRALAEAKYIKEKGGLLLAVDAPVEIRYERVQKRRSESDQVSFEQFVSHEELEKNDTDPHGMQKAAVMEMADYTLKNASSIEALENEVEELLKRLDK